MLELGADDLDHLGNVAGVFGSLKYEPRRPDFHAARKALTRLGASYDWHIRAWRVPVNDDTGEPLKRLYSCSSLALRVAEPGELVTAASFGRYTG